MTADLCVHNMINPRREPIDLKWNDFKWPLFYCLSMAMVGLMFPLGYLFVVLILLNRFRNDRYDFIIMLTIFLGGYGFTAEGSFPVKTSDIALVISVLLLFLYRKHGIVKKTVVLWLSYCAVLFVIAMMSEETLGIQFRIMRNNFAFIYFIVPLACFIGHDFEMKTFFRHLMPYLIIIAAFYVLDGFVIGGFIFMPRTSFFGDYAQSYFYSPIIYGFLSIVRKYPEGLIFLALGIYPIAKFYKLPLWVWALMLGACAASQTFTVISGFVVGYLVASSSLKNVFKYILLIPVLFTTLYFIDSLLPTTRSDVREQSFFRIKSSIDQIFELMDAADDVDFANFGSGRMGQALPKMELVSDLNREWIGLGFLHPKLTTNPKFIIENEYYINTEESEEVATQLIETEVLQTYVTSGFIGLIALFVFYFMTYMFVRKFAFGLYYLSVLVMAFWFGMGAYGGLTTPYGLLMVGLAYSVTLLEKLSAESRVKTSVISNNV